MAALHVAGTAKSMAGMPVSGATAGSFLVPLLLVISLLTFVLTLALSMTPGEDEIRADQELRRRMELLEQRGSERV
jgi:hypothetical protein